MLNNPAKHKNAEFNSTNNYPKLHSIIINIHTYVYITSLTAYRCPTTALHDYMPHAKPVFSNKHSENSLASHKVKYLRNINEP